MALRSFVDPIGSIPKLPASMHTRPGSNFSGHLTDATSGGRAGYGSYLDPSYAQTAANYVSAMPDVIAAKLAITNQGGQSYDQMLQSLQNQLVGWGDSSLASKLTAFDPRTGKMTSVLDPATAALAGANTDAGHSVIAQLRQQAQTALGAQLQELAGRGFESQGGSGVAINLSNRDLGNAVYNQGQDLLSKLSGAINTNNTTQQGLQDNYSNALLKAPQTIAQNPGLYPMPTQQTITVGGGMPSYQPASEVGSHAAQFAGHLASSIVPQKPIAAPHYGGMGHIT